MKQQRFSFILLQLLLKFMGTLVSFMQMGSDKSEPSSPKVTNCISQPAQALSTQDRSQDRGVWISGAI